MFLKNQLSFLFNVDFQKLIKGTTKDEELAEKIDVVKEPQLTNDLRREIIKTTQDHFSKLMMLSPNLNGIRAPN